MKLQSKRKGSNAETNLTFHNNEVEATDVEANFRSTDNDFANLNDIINIDGLNDTIHLDAAEYFFF